MQATAPPPWIYDSSIGTDDYDDPDVPSVVIGETTWTPDKITLPGAGQELEDAEFMAHVCQDVPNLRAQLIDIQAKLARVEDLVKKTRCMRAALTNVKECRVDIPRELGLWCWWYRLAVALEGDPVVVSVEGNV